MPARKGICTWRVAHAYSLSALWHKSSSRFGSDSGGAGEIVAPPGYEIIPLVDSSNQPFAPNNLAVSSTGEMVTLTTDPNTFNTVATLYNTWQNGRTVIATATNPNWTFNTDPVFLNNSTILFGDNTSSSTDTLWKVDFSNPSLPTETQMTSSGALPSVEGVLPINSTTALVSGDTTPGSLYLDSVDLTKTSNNVTPLQTGVGTDYPGNPGISPAGSNLLLEDVLTGDSLVHVFPSTGPASTIDLGNGNGFGASGIAFDQTGNAYVTTGDTITAITGIDSATPTVTQFAPDNTSDAFLTSISFTGGAFNPGEAGDTGALIVNDSTFGEGGAQAYAIVVPEPASFTLVAGLAIVGLSRRRKNENGSVRNRVSYTLPTKAQGACSLGNRISN